MSTISKDTYRSAGKGVNCTDDMVRVTINLTRKEFNRIEHRLEAALKSSESRPTVRAKRPAQQRKADKPLCGQFAKCKSHSEMAYCGGVGSGAVSQFGCYRKPAARSAVAQPLWVMSA